MTYLNWVSKGVVNKGIICKSVGRVYRKYIGWCSILGLMRMSVFIFRFEVVGRGNRFCSLEKERLCGENC